MKLSVNAMNMNKINAFFAIGTVGMILLSLLHIFFALVIGLTSAHVTFFALYPVFAAFLAIGTGQIAKSNLSPVKK